MTDEQIEKAISLCNSNLGYERCIKECPCSVLNNSPCGSSSPCDEIGYIIRLKSKIKDLENENDRLQGLIKQNDEAVWEMEEKITKGTAKAIFTEMYGLVCDAEDYTIIVNANDIKSIAKRYGVKL